MDFSAVRKVKTLKNLHNGRFARAVFPHDSMHLAFVEGQAHII
jgi:hypothetical protein